MVDRCYGPLADRRLVERVEALQQLEEAPCRALWLLQPGHLL